MDHQSYTLVKARKHLAQSKKLRSSLNLIGKLKIDGFLLNHPNSKAFERSIKELELILWIKLLYWVTCQILWGTKFNKTNIVVPSAWKTLSSLFGRFLKNLLNWNKVPLDSLDIWFYWPKYLVALRYILKAANLVNKYKVASAPSINDFTIWFTISFALLGLHPHMHSLSLSLPRTHTPMHTLIPCSLSLSYTPFSLFFTFSLIHTCTLAHTHTNTHSSHTHTHTSHKFYLRRHLMLRSPSWARVSEREGEREFGQNGVSGSCDGVRERFTRVRLSWEDWEGREAGSQESPK